MHPYIDKQLFGRTLIIANPKAQSGAGKQAAERLVRFLTMYLHVNPSSFDLVLTKAPRHAIQLASQACGYKTVCALGGDGIIHEVINGLMQIPAEKRPQFCLLPIGSGNDFARTLGITDYRGQDFKPLLNCRPVKVDVGRIRHSEDGEPCSTTYFIETFSFGLDAAIALETETIRAKTKLVGDALYLTSALYTLKNNYRSYPSRANFDGIDLDLNTIVMAVQLGPTYGSGFNICPDANNQDGLFDICYAKGPYPRLGATKVLLQAKEGKHVGHKRIRILRAAHIVFDLPQAWPAQTDGEKIEATHFDIDILKQELTVLKPYSTTK